MPRIVSLIASATEIVFELGLGASLVGRSHECDFPPGVERLPCCTRPRIDCDGDSRRIDESVRQSLAGALSIYEVFDDVLEALQPTHILTQTQCAVCAVSLDDVERSVARQLASRPRIVSLSPNSLADIWGDMRRVAASVDLDAEPAIARLEGRMRDLGAAARAGGERPRVACIEWLEPLMAAGNWVPELVEMAGGVNLFGSAGLHSPWMSWDDLVAADPDVVIAMPCGFAIARTLGEMHWITGRVEYANLRAVREGRVYVADGNQYFNRPGPRVVESLQVLTEIFRRGGGGLEGSGYVRYT
jgi:iron complex transport system substrate-binding protein